MKKIFIIFTFLCLTRLNAQIPINCIEIESILVDACGSPEGENEMVRFQVGPAPLVLSTMTIDWPNNSWLGLCQNATTTSVVATWNSTVTECGLLIEPTAGVIPAGKHVIIVTSTNVIPWANSFAGLSDTIYVIFQCAGNTNGHFANYALPSGLRTLIIFDGACSDTATYDRALLEDLLGNPAAANGATVLFDWPGNPDYINTGCNAPVAPLVVYAGANQTGFCLGDTVNLTATTQGSFTGYNWTGGTGTFINPTSDTNAFYIVGVGDISPINIFFSATNCNGSITDTMQVILNSPTPVNISPAGPITMCIGDTVQLTAVGLGPFIWNTTQTTASINVTTSGNYIVMQSSACGNSFDSVLVNSSGVPAVITPLGSTALCAGASLTLQCSGGTSYLWSTGQTTSSISITPTGNTTYTVTVFSGSCSDDTSISITVNPLPIPAISGATTICTGQSATLTASGGTNYSWSTGATTSSIVVSPASSTTYSVIASIGNCSDTASITVNVNSVIANAGTDVTINIGSSTTLIGSGGGTYSWNTGATTSSITAAATATTIYCVTVTDASNCTDMACVTIYVEIPCGDIFVPNAFSPNADRKNDILYVRGNCIKEMKFIIYNRWGEKVFEGNSQAEGWSGMFDGKLADSAVFAYYLTYILTDDTSGDKQGNVSLVR